MKRVIVRASTRSKRRNGIMAASVVDDFEGTMGRALEECGLSEDFYVDDFGEDIYGYPCCVLYAANGDFIINFGSWDSSTDQESTYEEICEDLQYFADDYRNSHGVKGASVAGASFSRMGVPGYNSNRRTREITIRATDISRKMNRYMIDHFGVYASPNVDINHSGRGKIGIWFHVYDSWDGNRLALRNPKKGFLGDYSEMFDWDDFMSFIENRSDDEVAEYFCERCAKNLHL